MLTTTLLNRVQKAAETLRGIVAGLVADYELNDKEIGALTEWLSLHSDLLVRPPFKDIGALIRDALRDHVLEIDEREDIILWCQDFSDYHSWPLRNITEGIRRLHGFLQGIAMDGVVTAREALDLVDWLHDYAEIREHWPFDDVWAFVEQIRKDGKVTSQEREELQAYCASFCEKLVSDSEVKEKREGEHFKTTAPFLLSIDSICASNPSVEFEQRTFCFTGNFVIGTRKQLHEIVTTLNGEPKNGVSLALDYLVIGTISEPTWAYSVYGRKIEAVRNNQNNGSQTLIIREDDFLNAARKHITI